MLVLVPGLEGFDKDIFAPVAVVVDPDVVEVVVPVVVVVVPVAVGVAAGSLKNSFGLVCCPVAVIRIISFSFHLFVVDGVALGLGLGVGLAAALRSTDFSALTLFMLLL